MSSELIVRYFVSKLYCVFSFNLRPLLEWDFLLFQIVFNYKRLGLGITAFKIFLFLSRYLGLDLKSSIVIYLDGGKIVNILDNILYHVSCNSM